MQYGEQIIKVKINNVFIYRWLQMRTNYSTKDS